MNAKSQKINWAKQAEAFDGEGYRKSAPFHVILGEAMDIAHFVSRYWSPAIDAKSKTTTRPGLGSAGKGLHASFGDDIAALVDEVAKAQSAYLSTVDAARGTTISDVTPRARFVLAEIAATLEYLFDDGVEDEKDLKLANVKNAHKDDPETADALAVALDDYATVANPYRGEMIGLGGFDDGLIDEAFALAKTLRTLPAVSPAASASARDALLRRNRLLQLLDQYVGRVRSAARFVFRHHPEIVRQATSAYARRLRVQRQQHRKPGSSQPLSG